MIERRPIRPNTARRSRARILPLLALAWLASWALGPLAAARPGNADPTPATATAVLSTPSDPEDPTHDPGTLAYRLADHASAETLWREALAAGPAPAERARLCANLGNAVYRQGRPREALGWYRAALRHEPGDRRAAANLEFVRRELGLPPRDDGGLGFALRQLAFGWSERGARRIALGGFLLLALTLLGEALRGGPWRLAAGLALPLFLLGLLPALGRANLDPDAHLVVSDGALAAHSEPRADSVRRFLLDPLEIVQRVDTLPGWTQVRREGEDPVWVRSEGIFALER